MHDIEWNVVGNGIVDLSENELEICARDIATRKVSIDSKPYIGTPERVADELARTIDAVGGDGFAIRQGIWPGYVEPFVDKVIPLLQKRGAVRTEYTGTTLREHLREF